MWQLSVCQFAEFLCKWCKWLRWVFSLPHHSHASIVGLLKCWVLSHISGKPAHFGWSAQIQSMCVCLMLFLLIKVREKCYRLTTHLLYRTCWCTDARECLAALSVSTNLLFRGLQNAGRSKTKNKKAKKPAKFGCIKSNVDYDRIGQFLIKASEMFACASVTDPEPGDAPCHRGAP